MRLRLRVSAPPIARQARSAAEPDRGQANPDRVRAPLSAPQSCRGRGEPLTAPKRRGRRHSCRARARGTGPQGWVYGNRTEERVGCPCRHATLKAGRQVDVLKGGGKRTETVPGSRAGFLRLPPRCSCWSSRVPSSSTLRAVGKGVDWSVDNLEFLVCPRCMGTCPPNSPLGGPQPQLPFE